LKELRENLPLVCRLGSPDARESLGAWLEVWTFIDEEGRARTLAEALWEGQRRFLEALLSAGHVLSIKSRKVGLSTLVCAHAAWTARVRDVNAAVHLLSYREDAARELLRSLRRGFDGLPSFLRLPLVRETSTVLAYGAGPGDTRSLKAFPATPRAAIEATSSHLVLDEWAHTFDPEAVWAAVRADARAAGELGADHDRPQQRRLCARLLAALAGGRNPAQRRVRLGAGAPRPLPGLAGAEAPRGREVAQPAQLPAHARGGLRQRQRALLRFRAARGGAARGDAALPHPRGRPLPEGLGHRPQGRQRRRRPARTPAERAAGLERG